MFIRIIIFTIILFNLVQTIAGNTLKIMHQENYYPYAFINEEGKSDGILIDYWRLWSQENSIDIQFVHSKKPHYIKDIIDGKVDIVAGMKYNDEWLDSIFYTEYIIRVKTIIFLRNDIKLDSIKEIDFPISTIDNTIINSNSDSLLANINFHHSNIKTLRKDIKSGNIKGYIYDYPMGSNVSKVPKGYYEFKHVRINYLRPIISNTNTELRQLILKGSTNISEDNLILLTEKWHLFGGNNTGYRILTIAVIILILISIVFIIIIRKQKKQANNIIDVESDKDWKIIIDRGENDLIEFKSSLRWDYRQEKPNKALEHVIAKTISAFLNTEGGMLFIGVDDDGNILGIEPDYKTMSKKNSDGFMLALTNVINQSLGKINHKYITINIISIHNKDVCTISIEKSTQPVFLGKDKNEEFYIRASASSQPMSMSDTYKYISTHWTA